MVISFARSKISVCGKISPKISQKQIRSNSNLQNWCNTNGLSPFWVLQLFQKNTKRKVINSTYNEDEDSYFGTIVEIQECWNIQIEGSVKVWNPGFYRVVWRIKLLPDYLDLSPLRFLTKVFDSEIKKPKFTNDEIFEAESVDSEFLVYTWNINNPQINDPQINDPQDQQLPNLLPMEDLNEKNINILENLNNKYFINHDNLIDSLRYWEVPFPVNSWFDLLIGFIEVKNHHNTVCFALSNSSTGFKYGLRLDYVALYPVSKAEYEIRNLFHPGPLLFKW